MTSARESYINALLALAGVEPLFDLAPAPMFLGRRHLTQRMHSLLREVPMSKLRLLSSYASMLAILVMAGWAAFLSFPLAGRAEVREVMVPAAQASPNSPGYVVTRAPLSYPPEAIQKRIEGTVFVELNFNAAGDIVDSRVLSGPEELRQAALQTALQGKYGIDVARSLQVEVDFKLPQGRTSTIPAGPAVLSGTVTGPGAAPLSGVTVTAANTLTGIATVTLTNGAGSYAFPALNPGTYRVKAELPGFETRSVEPGTLSADQHLGLMFSLQPGSGTSSFSLGPLQPAAGQRGTAAGVPVVVPPPPPAPGNVSLPSRVRIGGGVAAANLIQQVPPVYPQEAKDANVEGTVVLEAQINTDGVVENLTVVTGNPLLIKAAVDAVKQWVYKPVLLNGQRVPVVTTMTVAFSAQ
jgi:TonB family protein